MLQPITRSRDLERDRPVTIVLAYLSENVPVAFFKWVSDRSNDRRWAARDRLMFSDTLIGCTLLDLYYSDVR